MAKDIQKLRDNFKKYAERRAQESGYSVKTRVSTVKSVPPKYKITFEFVEKDFVNPKMQKQEKTQNSTPVKNRRLRSR